MQATKPTPDARAGSSRARNVLIGLAIAVVVLTLWTLVIGFALMRKYTIPSESNAPTLVAGDYVLTVPGVGVIPELPWIGAWIGRPPERGDLSVFMKPDGSKIDYVKRVVGMPGDTVQMRGGVLHLNGQPVGRLAIDDYLLTMPGSEPALVKRYVETLPGGVTHQTLDADPEGSLDDTAVFEVPAGHYFVMGDNRDNSSDSRDPGGGVGFVPQANFEGKAVLVYFSTSGAWPRWVH